MLAELRPQHPDVSHLDRNPLCDLRSVRYQECGDRLTQKHQWPATLRSSSFSRFRIQLTKAFLNDRVWYRSGPQKSADEAPQQPTISIEQFCLETVQDIRSVIAIRNSFEP